MRQWRSIAKEAIDRASIIVKFLCLLHVTDAYVVSSNHVLGPSMLPTLNITGDVVLVEHLSHRIGKLGSGDLVLVRSPLDPNRTLTKRIVAMEGDRVTFSLDPTRSFSSRSLVVPKGHVWIQGDNLYVSRDSRHFGPLPYGLIEGKVFMRLWFIGLMRQYIQEALKASPLMFSETQEKKYLLPLSKTQENPRPLACATGSPQPTILTLNLFCSGSFFHFPSVFPCFSWNNMNPRPPCFPACLALVGLLPSVLADSA